MTDTGFTDSALSMLAQRAGILTQWEDASGHSRHVDPPTVRSLLTALELPCMTPSQISESMHRLDQGRLVSDGDLVVVQAASAPRLRCKTKGRWKLILESGRVQEGMLTQESQGTVSMPAVSEPGYHTLIVEGMTLTLAVVPRRCPAIERAGGAFADPWGLVAQIYSLHTSESGGQAAWPVWMQGAHFGTVSDLAQLAAQEGASALALSPAHAMFSADPDRYSPYSPSSRLFLNAAYGDPVRTLGEGLVRQVLSRWSHIDTFSMPSSAQLWDWPQVTSLRLRLLRDLFEDFRRLGAQTLQDQFAGFRKDGGIALQRHALYETLHAHYVPLLGRAHGWRDWPQALQDPSSHEAAQFCREHAVEVEFHAFAQWIAHESAQQAQQDASASGLSHGLISDLAIGTDPRGSHAWSQQREILTDVSVGAPPDLYQPQGQNWGLTAFSPQGLKRGAYAAFIETVRANLRYSGGIRIDHVAGMSRLWLIPEGARADEGAYLTYPRDELLGLIALEATRRDAIVIGENLGTVSDDFNHYMLERGVAGTSVLWFEHEPSPSPSAAGSFRSAHEWSVHSVAMPSTHDLPTVHGWWQERDIQWKGVLGHLTRKGQKAAQQERALQRSDLWNTLQQNGCVAQTTAMPPEDTPLSAILSFVARTPSPLALFSLEDVLGVIEQPNMPGDVSGPGLIHHPNWVQRLPRSVDTLFLDDAIEDRLNAIQQARGARS